MWPERLEHYKQTIFPRISSFSVDVYTVVVCGINFHNLDIGNFMDVQIIAYASVITVFGNNILINAFLMVNY